MRWVGLGRWSVGRGAIGIWSAGGFTSECSSVESVAWQGIVECGVVGYVVVCVQWCQLSETCKSTPGGSGGSGEVGRATKREGRRERIS